MKFKSTSLPVVFLLICVLVQSSRAQVGRGKFGFGLSVDGNMLRSDWKTNDPGIGASTDVSYSLSNNWGLIGKLGLDTYYGTTSVNQNVLSTTFSGHLAVSYDFLRDKPVNPFVYAGAGFTFYTPRIDNGAALTSGMYKMWDISFLGGFGIDYYIDESWSIIATAEGGMLGNDQLDGVKEGGSNDIFGRVSVGIRYYLFDRSTVQQIVDAVKK